RTAAATRADGRAGRAPVSALAGQPGELPDRFHHPPRHRAVLAGRFADFRPGTGGCAGQIQQQEFLDRLCAGAAATDDRRGISRRM
ncbi:hypothetical protein HRR78_008869, partial [Exophiala dermatitidis]